MIPRAKQASTQVLLCGSSATRPDGLMSVLLGRTRDKSLISSTRDVKLSETETRGENPGLIQNKAAFSGLPQTDLFGGALFFSGDGFEFEPALL